MPVKNMEIICIIFYDWYMHAYNFYIFCSLLKLKYILFNFWVAESNLITVDNLTAIRDNIPSSLWRNKTTNNWKRIWGH